MSQSIKYIWMLIKLKEIKKRKAFAVVASAFPEGAPKTIKIGGGRKNAMVAIGPTSHNRGLDTAAGRPPLAFGKWPV